MSAKSEKPYILICDDDVECLRSLEIVFRNDYRTTTARTLPQAQEFIRRSNSKADVTGKFSVVIIDLSFKKSDPANADGFILLGDVVKDPFTEAVIYTGTGDQNKLIKAMKLGAYRFVSKVPTEGENPVELLSYEVAEAYQCREAVITANRIISSLSEKSSGHAELMGLYQALQKIRRRRN